MTSKLGRNPFQKIAVEPMTVQTEKPAPSPTSANLIDVWLVGLASESILLGLKTLLLAMDIFQKPKNVASLTSQKSYN